MVVGTHRSEFVYDGLQRQSSTQLRSPRASVEGRVRHVEQENGVATADTRVLWCETAIGEERAADGVTVTRRAFGLGEQVGGAAHYFATDHLGSVREVTDTAGTLLARYAFDPWGRRTITAGADVTTVGFTGHRTHTSSGLALTLYRGYDAGLGRWVSEDPIGLLEGPNYLSYTANDPVSDTDPLGLAKGGRKGIGVNHRGLQLTRRTPLRDVTAAIDEARRTGMGLKHIRALEGLAKVIKRGGHMGVTCLLIDCDAWIDALDCILNPSPGCAPPSLMHECIQA